MAGLPAALPETLHFPLDEEEREKVASRWTAPFTENWPAELAERMTATHRACTAAHQTFSARPEVLQRVFEPLNDKGFKLEPVIHFVAGCMLSADVPALSLSVLAGSRKVLHIPHKVKLAWLAVQALGGIEHSPPIRGTPRLGCMSLHRLLVCGEPLSIARLQALWLMWWQLSLFPHEACLQNDLIIERHSVDPGFVPSWLDSPSPLVSISVSSEQRIEDCAALGRTDAATAEPATKPAVSPADRNAGSAQAVVDFANKQLHIGKVIPSCTQEEVMFSVRPEAYLAIPLAATMADDEVITIRGARQVCDYTGYGSSFRVHAFKPPPTASAQLTLRGSSTSACVDDQVRAAVADSTPQGEVVAPHAAMGDCGLPPCLFHVEEHIPAVLAMDALWLTNPKRQFQQDSMERDLNKAATSFASVAATVRPGRLDLSLSSAIAAAGSGGCHDQSQQPQEREKEGAHTAPAIVCTGKWGCGVFNGDVTLKVLQQWAAASTVGVQLRVSTFGHPQQAQQLRDLLQHVHDTPSLRTVGGLLNNVSAFGARVLDGDAAVGDLRKHLMAIT